MSTKDEPFRVPETIPAADMDLFCREARLAGWVTTRDERGHVLVDDMVDNMATYELEGDAWVLLKVYSSSMAALISELARSINERGHKR